MMINTALKLLLFQISHIKSIINQKIYITDYLTQFRTTNIVSSINIIVKKGVIV